VEEGRLHRLASLLICEVLRQAAGDNFKVIAEVRETSLDRETLQLRLGMDTTDALLQSR
jgi:hypothetical protein